MRHPIFLRAGADTIRESDLMKQEEGGEKSRRKGRGNKERRPERPEGAQGHSSSLPCPCKHSILTSKCELGGQAPYDPQAARPTGREVMKLRKRDLRQQVAYLEDSLDSDRNFSSRLLEGVGAVLDFLDRHLPEQFRPLVERARELLPVPELQQPEQEQERGHTWGGMEL